MAAHVPDRVQPGLPPPLVPGDRVAVLSPSWAAPEQFPELHEQAMRRLREELALEPVEFPTTRRAGSPAERAADINAALADPSIRGIMATVGGDDQITVLKHLDPALLDRPKRFLGYSDNTNLANWLWFHGVGSVYGGSTQVHLGPGPRIDPEHLEVLRPALFGGDVELRAPARTRDFGLDWSTPAALDQAPPDQPAEPWSWHGPERVVSGPTWGGCLAIVEWTLAAGRYVRPVEDYAGCVLVLEADEEVPSAAEVLRQVRNLGERGLLEACAALVWGRPPVSTRERVRSVAEAAADRAERRRAVLDVVADYHRDLLVVLDVDLGHTSPQLLVPYGGRLTVDGVSRTLTAHF